MEDRYLFRGKRIDNGEWVEGALFNGESHCIIGQEIKFSPYTEHECKIVGYEVDRDTICQCTGLKDRNGKLIWEKDIVDGHIKRGAAFLNCLVLWNESKARFDVRAKGCNFPMTLDEVTGDMSVGGLDYEVVGNKFDNPELLEVWDDD